MGTDLTASLFKLQHRDIGNGPYADVVDELHGGGLPWASVDEVLDSANRTGAGRAPAGSGIVQGWRWQDGDGRSDWFPQGITTSADHDGGGVYNGRKVILVSWYENVDRPPGKGARISFVDMTTPSAPRYRHVLLVEPFREAAGTPNLKAVDVHAGGIMWYGDLLYVVDTRKGIRVFDTGKMMKVAAAGGVGRRSDGAYTAHDYLYVLPQTHAYDALSEPRIDPITWSFISLDRTTVPDSVVVGEYDSSGDGTRLFRWNIDFTTRLLRADDDVATAVLAMDVSIARMQGATSAHGKYYISRSNGGDPGNLLTLVPGSPVKSASTPRGPEDLSYDGTTGWLWSLTEPRGNRLVFARDLR